jgi:hypothetical protein
MVRTEGLLDWKVKVSAVGAALNAIPLPTSRETLGPGVRETPVGVTSLETVVGLPPPQEGKRPQATIKIVREIAEKNFPMKPFKEECDACSGKHSV